MSEGVRNPDGKFLADAGTRDAFGHAQLGGVGPVVAQLVKDKLGYKYHWAVADYLQRAARHIASKVDVEQAYAVGKAAVEYALEGHNAVMPAIVRTSHRPYRWKIGIASLEKVANKEKMLPRDYITPDGFQITAKGRRYLAPLIVGRGLPAVRGWPAEVCANCATNPCGASSKRPLWYSPPPFFGGWQRCARTRRPSRKFVFRRPFLGEIQR